MRRALFYQSFLLYLKIKIFLPVKYKKHPILRLSAFNLVTRTGFATMLPHLHAHVGKNSSPNCFLPLRSLLFESLLKINRKRKNQSLRTGSSFCGDPDGIRTRVTAVKGRCLRPLDHRAIYGGCNWTRTNDTPGMNRML